MLLAIAMSLFYEKTHVLFLPPDTTYLVMLEQVKRKKLVKHLTPSYYTLTEKGMNRLKQWYKEKSSEKDKEIDSFIDNL